MSLSRTLYLLSLLLSQAGLIEANGELKVFIDQNLSPGKGKASLSEYLLLMRVFRLLDLRVSLV